MTRRVVIADAGPLNALARIDALDLLNALFGCVYITTTVHDEILPPGFTFAETNLLGRTLIEGWLKVVPVPGSDFRPLNPGIDAGEASAIAMACTWQAAGDAVLLFMDDRAGRLEAKNHSISLIGTAAVIGLAKTEGHIPAARPLLERLVATGYYIGPAVVAAVLAESQEA